MTKHLRRPVRYALSQADFIIMGTALSIGVGMISVAVTIALFGSWR